MITGRCLCGAVRFEGQEPALFSCHCHCEWCRRAHGAAFVTWLGLRDDGFRVTAGDDALRWFSSSEKSRRGFCSTCGTTLFFATTLAPGEMHVALACVDDAASHPPRAHVFWDAHVPWNGVADDLPKLDRDDKRLDKYQSLPRTPPR
jgi:hypothetical protein